jgi:hypothetical protein
VLWEIPERVIEMDRKNDVQLTIKWVFLQLYD